MDTKKYYKVVKQSGGLLYSAIAMGGFGISYRVGEVIRPKFGKLFVFDDYDRAVYFGNGMATPAVLFECEVTNPTKAPAFIPSADWCNLPEYWVNGELNTICDRDHQCFPSWACPEHTVLVSSLKLTTQLGEFIAGNFSENGA